MSDHTSAPIELIDLPAVALRLHPETCIELYRLQNTAMRAHVAADNLGQLDALIAALRIVRQAMGGE